jgi:hypothetical protein
MQDDVWVQEEIPDDAVLYMRAHKQHFIQGKWQPGVFKLRPEGMSTDWERYSTSAETRARAPKPLDNAVFALVAGGIRSEPLPLEVIHTPNVELKDRAHTDVIGEKSTEARLKLSKLYKVAIELDDPL